MGDLKLPVTIALHAADGGVSRVRWRGESDHLVVPYDGPSPLFAAVVDPDLTVLIDNDLSNNARRVDGRARTPRLASTLAAVANLLLTVVAP